jgi:rubrerythrin
MQLTQTLTRRRERPTRSARRAAEPRPRPAQSVSQVRARRGGGNQDRALYSCECGFAWKGEVTASPGCPHCGTPQAW